MHKMDQRGFTLMELVVAAAFIGIVIVSLMELFTGIRQINRAANTYTTATLVAQQIMEKYRNTPYSSIATGTVDYASYLTPYPILLTPRSATATITAVNTSIKRVEVAVSYKDRTGVKNVAFSTQIGNKGINK